MIPAAPCVISVKRSGLWFIALKYRVELDGSEVGRIRVGGKAEVQVPPGLHSLKIYTGGGGSSPPTQLDAHSGGRIVVRVSGSVRARDLVTGAVSRSFSSDVLALTIETA